MNCITHVDLRIALTLVILALTGCAAPPKPKTLPVAQEAAPVPVDNQTAVPDVATIKQALSAEQLDIPMLMGFVETLIAADQPAQAKALLFALAPHLPVGHHGQAKALLALTTPADAATSNRWPSAWLERPLSDDALEPLRLARLVASYSAQGDILKAKALSAQQAADDVLVHHEIFDYLSTLDTSALVEAEKRYPALRPHIALVQLIRTQGDNNDEFAPAVAQFQKVYFAHPLTQPLPDAVSSVLQLPPEQLEDVVVMLPLSGRFASTGDAVRQGMLAAYFAVNQTQPNAKVRFLDTALLSHQDLIEQAAGASWVVGPLLKTNIDAVLPYLTPTTKRLALNRLDPAQYQDGEGTIQQATTAYFGLAPEDEAIQLANYVARQGYKHPILVASNMGTSKRMLDAFTAFWRQHHGFNLADVTLDVVQFDNIDTLDKSLSEALGVAQSENNAKQIDRMTNRILFDQTRSRQDIDAIVVFSSPEEMALINPMVEASISPFRQQNVPVYSTSRSLERSSARNTLRDLENVRFLDAPLILNPDQWADVSASLHQIWPNHTASFSRLFAFGYDAMTMLTVLPRLAQLPGYQYPGMSGLLQIGKDGEVTRTLPMAKIQQQTITRVDE